MTGNERQLKLAGELFKASLFASIYLEFSTEVTQS